MRTIVVLAVLGLGATVPPLNPNFSAICALPFFDAAGNNVGSYTACPGEFEILTK